MVSEASAERFVFRARAGPWAEISCNYFFTQFLSYCRFHWECPTRFFKINKSEICKSKEGDDKGGRHESCRRGCVQSRKQTRRNQGIHRLQQIWSRYLSDCAHVLPAFSILGSLFLPRAPFATLEFDANGGWWPPQKTNPAQMS